MAFPNDQLFLDRFIDYNKERYVDEADFVQSLSALSLNSITFQNRRAEVAQDGTPFFLVDMSSPKLFIAHDQQYTPGDYIIGNASSLVDEDPLVLADLQARFVPGIYKLQLNADTIDGAVLVKAGEKTQANIFKLVKDSCLYVLDDSNLSINQDLTIVTVSSNTVIGTLTVVESTNVDESAHYDGEYLYDGALTY